MKEQVVDVIISGLGPTGAMAANLLGKYGISTAVIEKEKDIYPLPRGIVIDDDVARIFQQAGLKDEILSIGYYSKGYNFLDQSGNSMFGFKRDFTKKELGFASSLMIHQPSLEKVLRDGLNQYSHVSVYKQHELKSVTERENEVIAEAKDLQNNEEVHFRGKYLLTCEGGRSVTRKALNINLTNYHFDHTWLVVDTVSKDGSLGLTDGNLQYCTPSRPTTYIYAGENRYRWEFKIHSHEDVEKMNTEKGISELISKWVDPTKLTIQRSVVYTFHALIAQKWKEGRIFLLGDTAHQMPPFLGQGLCSGLRDAHNLVWKIQMVFNGHAKRDLLDTYETERKPQIETIIKKAVQVGHIIQVRNKTLANLRDKVFKALNDIPNVSEALQNIVRSSIPLGEGVFDESHTDKRFFIQPEVLSGDGENILLDESFKDPSFIILGLNKNPLNKLRTVAIEFLNSINAQFVQVSSEDRPIDKENELTLLQDTHGRIQKWLDEKGAEFVILRPDKYVFGVYTESELNESIFTLKDQILALKNHIVQ